MRLLYTFSLFLKHIYPPLSFFSFSVTCPVYLETLPDRVTLVLGDTRGSVSSLRYDQIRLISPPGMSTSHDRGVGASDPLVRVAVIYSRPSGMFSGWYPVP